MLVKDYTVAAVSIVFRRELFSHVQGSCEQTINSGIKKRVFGMTND